MGPKSLFKHLKKSSMISHLDHLDCLDCFHPLVLTIQDEIRCSEFFVRMMGEGIQSEDTHEIDHVIKSVMEKVVCWAYQAVSPKPSENSAGNIKIMGLLDSYSSRTFKLNQ
jgi:hypothetical protein